jgi:hypothetical protein
MDPAENRELMAQQAAALAVVMVSYVMSRIRRSRPEPDPLLYHLRSDVEQYRKQTLQAIYNSTDAECLSMLRMTRAPFFLLFVTCLELGGLYLRSQGAQLRSRLLCSYM